MFPAEKAGEWEPLKVREKKVRRVIADVATNGTDGEDVKMEDGAEGEPHEAEEETIYEEDPSTDEGAVYPLKDGRVINWSAFFALLTHVYNTLSPPFHTPILLITQPAWTEQDHETLTQFFFEKFKTPAFCLMDSALAVCYAYGVPTATVVDVGYGKCDVTAVSDFLINHLGRAIAISGCGGEGMTQRLFELLEPKGFTEDMCEQLKKSSVCEVLPPSTPLPEDGESGKGPTNPAAFISTVMNGSSTAGRASIAGQGGLTSAMGAGPAIIEDDLDSNVKDGENDDGVLDVASIVASGKTSEFLARKEREKAEKAAAKKAAADAAAAPRRLPNSQRVKATFHYDERRSLDDLNANGKRINEIDGAAEGSDSKRQRTPELVVEGDISSMSRKEERRRNKGTSMFVRKDIEVGIERFRTADAGILDQIADSIHRCVLSVPEVGKRSELWDSLIVLGNGSKVRGKITPSHCRHLYTDLTATSRL